MSIMDIVCHTIEYTKVNSHHCFVIILHTLLFIITPPPNPTHHPPTTQQAVRLACASLVTRLTPIAEKLREEGHPVTWSSIIARAFIMSWAAPLTQLQTIDQYGGTVPGGAMGEGPPEKLQYCVFGAAVSEVEVDVLTGERHIVRSDVLFDVGKSMNPGVDVGQIEGAFVMV